MLLLDKIPHARAHFVVIGRELTELQPIERFIHGSGGGQREDVRHARFQLHRQLGVVQRRTAVCQRKEDFVLIQQLVHALHGPRHGVLRILHHVAYLPAIHAALGIRIVEGQADRIGVVDTLHGGYTGKVCRGSNDDFRIGHALRGAALSGCSPDGCAGKRQGKRTSGQQTHRPAGWRSEAIGHLFFPPRAERASLTLIVQLTAIPVVMQGD